MSTAIAPAVRVNGSSCEIRTIVPASLDAIESLFADFRRCAERALQKSGSFTAELLLREALTNAVVHGCDCNPARWVRCALRIRGRKLTIVVADGGPGFDWRTARSREAQVSDCSGRGLGIFRRYATHFRFNDTGNAVSIFKDFDQGV